MYDTKKISAAHTQTAAQNQLIMAAKITYDTLYCEVLNWHQPISLTPSFAYGKDQLNLQGVHTAHNRWHEVLENDRNHSNITCRAELDVGPPARESTVERNSALDPQRVKSMSQPLDPREKASVSTALEPGWAWGAVWMSRGSLDPTQIRAQRRPSSSQLKVSSYRHLKKSIFIYKTVMLLTKY